MRSVRLTKGWSLGPHTAPTVSHYLLALALGICGVLVGRPLHVSLLGSLAAALVSSYLGGLGPGLIVSLTVLVSSSITVHGVASPIGVFEVAIACSTLAWSVARFRDAERTSRAAKLASADAQRILKLVPVSVWSAAPDGQIFTVNDRVLEFTGEDRDYFENRSGVGAMAERQKRAEHLHPDDRDRVPKKWLATRDSADHYEDEFRLRRHDGTYQWFKTVAERMSDDDGTNRRWYGALVNIERQKQIEQELRQVEYNLRLIIETIPAFVWYAGPDGGNQFVNQRLLDYTGVSADDFQGDGWASFLHPDDVAATNYAWKNALERGGPYHWSYRMRRADGVYEWFLVLAELLRDESGAPLRWFGVDFNIDGQRRAEELLGETQERLMLSAQFATVAEFSAAIAHEVNQPLFGAIMNMEACLSWLSADPPNIGRARESAALATEDGKDASNVIHKVRALFRKSEPSKELLDLSVAIGDVIRLMRDELTRKRTTIEVVSDEGLPPVHADRLQIQQVMWNLVHNAIDAMEGLSVEKSIQIEIRSHEPGVEVSVRDHGKGFPDADRAFGAFYTTKANGMGMGLTISQTIIEAHGGRLAVRATSDAGTTLAFTIPNEQHDS